MLSINFWVVICIKLLALTHNINLTSSINHVLSESAWHTIILLPFPVLTVSPPQLLVLPHIFLRNYSVSPTFFQAQMGQVSPPDKMVWTVLKKFHMYCHNMSYFHCFIWNNFSFIFWRLNTNPGKAYCLSIMFNVFQGICY